MATSTLKKQANTGKTLYSNMNPSVWTPETYVEVDLENYNLFEIVLYLSGVSSSTRHSAVFNRADIYYSNNIPLGENKTFRASYANGRLNILKPSDLQLMVALIVALA